MHDEAAVVAVPLRNRLRHGLRKPANWWELVRFAVVGASGYGLNLATYELALQLGAHYRSAATVAFVVGVTNNFWWNRRWTFGALDGHAGFQAVRFFVVSVLAFLFSLLVLDVLVTDAGVPKLASQAIAIVAATPLNFLGNKLWSFGR